MIYHEKIMDGGRFYRVWFKEISYDKTRGDIMIQTIVIDTQTNTQVGETLLPSN